MPHTQKIQQLLNRGNNEETKYNWLDALNHYDEASNLAISDHDFVNAGEIQERIGHCSIRLSYQSETQAEFKRFMKRSHESYMKATEFYESIEDSTKVPKILSSKAMALFTKSWLVTEISDRNTILDECLELDRLAINAWEEAKIESESGIAINELLTHISEKIKITTDWQEAKNIILEAIDASQRGISIFTEVSNERELARTYFTTSQILSERAYDVFESIEKQQELNKLCLNYAKKAHDIAEKISDPYLIGMISGILGYSYLEAEGDVDPAIKYAERFLEIGKKLKDNLMVARANELLAYFKYWKTSYTEDPEQIKKICHEAIQKAEDALKRYEMMSHPVNMAYVPHIECILELSDAELNLKNKRRIIKKAIEIGRKDLLHAETTGSNLGKIHIYHAMASAISRLSDLETNKFDKIKLLKEAIDTKEKQLSLEKQSNPFNYWNLAGSMNYLAKMKAERAKLEIKLQNREELFIEAITEMKDSIENGNAYLEAFPHSILDINVVKGKIALSDTLNALYSVTADRKYLAEAIEHYNSANTIYIANERQVLSAETHWKLANIYDQLKDHLRASKEFESAYERYILAVEKLPHLTLFYTQYATYMKAWSEIEKAKHHHTKEQYLLSKEYYQKAADLHEETKWGYLHLNYLTWARLEEAEDTSRKDKTENARDIFLEVADSFLQVKKILETAIDDIDTEDELEMANNLVKASTNRQMYCLGRAALEEAKLLDRKGEHEISSMTYGSAANTFQKIHDSMENISERQELLSIINLCHAWEMMTKAEADANPALYQKASDFFEKAKENIIKEKAKLLALGHSRFCKALEYGMRYEFNKDESILKDAIQYLSNAATFYIRAGYTTALEYAKGIQRLFDAFNYLENANISSDPEEKTRYYMMTEKVLGSAVESFQKANHFEKSEETRRILKQIVEEKALAISLGEVLEAPLISSTTVSFNIPSQTHEYAVGLESFEHANLQANLYLKSKDINSGENLDFTIEIFNTGKAPASLVKVEELIPENFEVIRVPGYYKITNQYLDMKGKKLGPLSTEEISVLLKPVSKGEYMIKPRIIYMDVTGEHKSCEPEPENITVTEMGILGWIRGPRPPRAHLF